MNPYIRLTVDTVMVEVATTELSGAALCYAVATAEGLSAELTWCFREDGSFFNIWTDNHGSYRPEYWDIGGPLIEKYKPWLSPPVSDPDPEEPEGWDAEIYSENGFDQLAHIIAAPTALVAVCRAIVQAKLGAVVSVPADLVQAVQP